MHLWGPLTALGLCAIVLVTVALGAVCVRRDERRFRLGDPAVVVGGAGLFDRASAAPDVVDVSETAGRLVTVSRRLTAITVGGTVLVGVGFGFDSRTGSPSWTLLAIFGTVLVASVIRRRSRQTLPDVPIHLRRRSRVLTGRRRPLAIGIVIVAGFVWVIGMFLVILTGYFHVEALAGVVSRRERFDWGLVGWTVVFGSLAVGIVAVATVLYGFADRVAAPDARRARESDGRRPVMVLRTFDDDAIEVRARITARHRLVDRFRWSRRERFEELIDGTLSAVGPVIALADPGRQWHPVGVARHRAQDASWQDAVRRHLDSSVLNVVVMGRGAGLRWEIDTILRSDPELGETVFVVPPVPEQDAAGRWRVLATMTGSARSLPARTLVVRLVAGEPLFYVAGARNGVSYEAALLLAVRDVISTSDPATWDPPSPHGAAATDLSDVGAVSRRPGGRRSRGG